jgi:hypothetical protein
MVRLDLGQEAEPAEVDPEEGDAPGCGVAGSGEECAVASQRDRP